jgi:hypothetical protein
MTGNLFIDEKDPKKEHNFFRTRLMKLLAEPLSCKFDTHSFMILFISRFGCWI